MKSKFSTLLLVSLLAFSALTQTACWGGSNASRTRKIIEQLDNNATATRESQLALSQLLSLKLINTTTAGAIGSKVDAFRAANAQIIAFFDQPGFKTTTPDGKVVITIAPANKDQATTLINTLIATGQAIVSDQNLFPKLSPESRAAFSALIAAAGSTTKSLLDLVNGLKATAGKTTTISIPAADWRVFERAREVQFGY
jgi:hypothetical protein